MILGPLIEEKYGSLNYLIMILITALVVGIFNFIKGNAWLKGASSISFMLTVLSAFVNINGGKIPITFVLIILFYLVDEVKSLRKKDHIAHDSHLIGGLCGAVFGFICINEELVNIIVEFFKNIN